MQYEIERTIPIEANKPGIVRNQDATMKTVILATIGLLTYTTIVNAGPVVYAEIGRAHV